MGRAAALAIAAIASVDGAVAQQLPTQAPRFTTYEEWRDQPTGGLRGVVAWSHDPAGREWWREHIERFWQNFDGWDLDHPNMWVFIRLGDGDPYDAYQARWVADCLQFGDIVIPYASAPRSAADSLGRGPEDAPRYLSFAVFAAGASPEGIERVLRTRLGRQDLTPEEIEAVVQTYRAMYPAN
jgi:hypothetical protein